MLSVLSVFNLIILHYYSLLFYIVLNINNLTQTFCFCFCITYYCNVDADPHNSTRGFFFAHIGWLLLKKHPDRVEVESQLDYTDLWADPLVRIQHKCDPFFAVPAILSPCLVACYGWNESVSNSIFVVGCLRYCFVLHVTFLVNSAAHLWGDHPYDSKIAPAENPIVSYLAGGEGWHNWHHRYPFDYAASEFGISSQFNPSKLLIDTFAFLGLVRNRKRATSSWRRYRERMATTTNNNTDADRCDATNTTDCIGTDAKKEM